MQKAGTVFPGESPGGMDTQGTNEGQSCCGLHIWVLPEFAELNSQRHSLQERISVRVESQKGRPQVDRLEPLERRLTTVTKESWECLEVIRDLQRDKALPRQEKRLQNKNLPY